MAQTHQPDECWNPAQPQHIPSPTYWPVVLALGIAFLFWGFVTSFIISMVGIIIFGTALAGWITELRHEFKEQTELNQSGVTHGS